MSSNKYPNGMYKTTSKKQFSVSQDLFKALDSDTIMGMNFDQVSGICKYNIKTKNNQEFNYFVDYTGKIVKIETVKVL
jgi:hypothetical protein